MSGPQDIVTELRSWGNAGADFVMHRAADEIERLREEVRQLRAVMPAHISRILYEGEG
jgi:copper homeostasis protein CutC